MHPLKEAASAFPQKPRTKLKPISISYQELISQTPNAIVCAKEAFCERSSFGALEISDVPNWKECRDQLTRQGTELAFSRDMQNDCQADVRVGPGWMGTPGQESHSLQSGFYANTKQKNKSKDSHDDLRVWGANRWPSPKNGNDDSEVSSFKATITSAACVMNHVALLVLDLAQKVAVETLDSKVERGVDTSQMIPTLRQMAEESNFLPARLVYYDANFEREDKIITEDDQQSYWLPWHVDFNLVTAFAPAMWINEATALKGDFEKSEENCENPECRAGLLLRNFEGKIIPAAIGEDSILIQLGALTQLTTAGLLRCGPHAVGKESSITGFGRLSFGLFVYGPWKAKMKPSEELLKALGDDNNVLKYDFRRLMEKAYTGDTVLDGYKKFESYYNKT